MSKVQKFLANEGGIHKRRLEFRPIRSAIIPVANTDKGRDRLLVDLVLLEADPFVILLDWRTGTDLAMPLADAERDG